MPLAAALVLFAAAFREASAQVACAVDADCPNPQPDNVCLQRCCSDGMCKNVSAVNCDDQDPCTNDQCVSVGVGLYECQSVRDPLCCQQASQCPVPNDPCLRASCLNYTLATGKAVCSFSEKSNCCEADEDCTVPHNLCTVFTCDLTTNSCQFPGTERVCPGDPGDLCKAPVCNATTGQCGFVELDEQMCPGACCLPNGACIEQDDPCCAEDGGVFFGVNTRCSNVQCGVPPAPECPGEGVCQDIGGFCVPLVGDAACPAGFGQVSEGGLCRPSDPTAQEQCQCACCAPCEELACPNHPGAQCASFGPCVNGTCAGAPGGSTCFADADCECKCRPYVGGDLVSCEYEAPPTRECRHNCDCLDGADFGDLCVQTWCTEDGVCVADRKANCPRACESL